MKIKEFKLELKKCAALLRESKHNYKEYQRGNLKQDDYYKLIEKGYLSSDTYRHMHIAYCLLRGRSYEQIENKVRDGNEPRWNQIERYMQKYREVEEIQCTEVVNV